MHNPAEGAEQSHNFAIRTVMLVVVMDVTCVLGISGRVRGAGRRERGEGGGG